jgi:hypothetical protein
MEYGAFAEILYTRTSVRADGAILFKLYPEFAMGSSARALAAKHGKYSTNMTSESHAFRSVISVDSVLSLAFGL